MSEGSPLAANTRESVKAELAGVQLRRAKVLDAIKAATRERQATGKMVDNRYWGKLLEEQGRLVVQARRLEAQLSSGGNPLRDGVRHAFMDVARERLAPEVFNEWRDEARRRSGVANGELP